MKQTFVILFCILLAGNSCGQKKDSIIITLSNGLSVTEMPDSVRRLLLSTWATAGNRINDFTITPRQDTIRVLMLVCDTMGWPHTSIGSVIPSAQAYNEGRVVWWQYGYEVPVLYERGGMGQLWVDKDGYVIALKPIYLDQNKKPLPKNIIVWMIKEIKN